MKLNELRDEWKNIVWKIELLKSMGNNEFINSLLTKYRNNLSAIIYEIKSLEKYEQWWKDWWAE